MDPVLALGVLPVSWLGVALVLLASLFFAVDLIVTSHGLPTFAGILALLFGVFTLYYPSTPLTLASLVVLVALAGLLVAVLMASSSAALAAVGRPAMTGAERMVGEVGVVRETLCAGSAGWVLVRGELWRAIPAVPPEDVYDSDEQDQTIGVGCRVQVVGCGDGRVLVVPFEPASFERSFKES
ncbi:MAG: hypothetical protein M3122_04180 [Actinomycetota bacterium]|nr:hypothetical protein [Actinomycetota bacterium]